MSIELKKIIRHFPFLMVLAIALFEPQTFAQPGMAALSVSVVDVQEASISGAKVSLTNISTGAKKEIITSQGRCDFLVPPGLYSVHAERDSFVSVEVPSLILNVNDRLTMTLHLKIGPISQTIDVITTPPIKNQSGSVSTVIDRQFVNELPLNGRSFDSLLRLTPGSSITVAQSWEPGQFSFNGQRSNANYLMVDGVGANAGISSTNFLEQTGAGTTFPVSALGGTNSLVPVDALEEFRIDTSSYAAESGRMPGAQISIVTRSGTNTFHGTLFNYFRHDALDAADWFANSLGLEKAPLRQNDFGGVLGGPIVRNRTFFFVSYEGLRLRLPQTVVHTSVPSLNLRHSVPAAIQPLLNAFPVPNGNDQGDGFADFSASFSNPSSVDSMSFRIDHAVNNGLSLFGRYSDAPSDVTYRGGLGGASLSMATRGSSRTITATIGANLSLGARANNDFRINYSRARAGVSYPIDDFGGAVPPPLSALFPSFADAPHSGFGLNLSGVGAYWIFGPFSENYQRQVNIVDNLSFVTGHHALRFGVDYRRLSPISQVQSYTLQPTFNTSSDLLAGQASRITVGASRGTTYPLFTNFSAYSQDVWQVTRRFTLTYGLRWELNPPPDEARGNMPFTVQGLDDPATLTLAPPGTPFYETTYGNFAPRISASYALVETPGRQMVLRGGFGMFYDLGSGTASSAFAAAGFPNSSSKTVTNVPFSLTSDDLQPAPFTANPPYPELFVTDPHLSLPRSYHWNIAVEHSFGKTQSIALSYVGAAGRRLLRREYLANPNANFPSGVEVTRNTAFSNYHALQIQFERRLSRGLQALASYVWGHATDNDSRESEPFRSVAATGERRDHGSSDFDIRHSLSAAATYSIPNPWHHSKSGVLLRGWSINGIVRINSAPPINAIASVTRTGVTRPNVIPGVPFYLEDSTYPGGKRVNIAAFEQPPAGQQGTLGRNALRGFGVSQTDLALTREFRLSEGVMLQIRADSFNLFNHPNFAQPPMRIGNPARFGRSQSMLNQSLGFDAGLNPLYQIGGPRSFQLSAKMSF
jgi:hypothetical protein